MSVDKGSAQPRLVSAAVLVAVFVMSVSVLIMEISVTRISSVMFSYHYAFLAVATTFAGLGMGGVLGGYLLKKTPKVGLIPPLALSCIVFVLMALSSLLLTTGLPAPNFALNTILLFAAFLPAGFFLSTSYRYLSSLGNAVYAADVLGAAVGSILIITLLEKVDPFGSILMVSLVLASALVFTTLASRSKKLIGVNVALVFALVAILLSPSVFNTNIKMNAGQGKELYSFLNDPKYGASITESRWSPFGRTDLVDLKAIPDYKLIFIDGGAGSFMYRFSGDVSNVSDAVGQLRNTTAAFPYYFSGKEDVLIIGPGGGIDVLTGLLFNVTNIHAVEINGDMVDIVNEYSDYNGGIYTRFDNVQVHVDEGRNYLRRTRQSYDAIVLNIPITKTLQGTFENSMAENYLFTVESMRDYLGHLKDDGLLVVVAHDPAEVYKLVTTTIEANGGASTAKQTLRQIVATEGHDHPAFPVVVVKKTPFSQEESASMLAKSDELNMMPIYFPYINGTERSRLDPNLLALEEGTSVADLVSAGARASFDLLPPVDDRPFFYKFDVGLPDTLSQLLTVSTILAFAGLTAYVVFGRGKEASPDVPREKSSRKPSLFMVLYFATIGVGFMLFEAPVIQKFMLFLGPPTIAISTVLFGLLLWMGVGGLLSKRYGSPKGVAFKAALLIGVSMILYTITLPVIFDSLLGLDLVYRLASAFLLLGPAGLLLGIPFSAGIAIMDQEYHGRDVAWMWGVNGLFSLLGSSLAASLAMLAGFNATILVGAGLYLIISFVGISRMNQGDRI